MNPQAPSKRRADEHGEERAQALLPEQKESSEQKELPGEKQLSEHKKLSAQTPLAEQKQLPEQKTLPEQGVHKQQSPEQRKPHIPPPPPKRLIIAISAVVCLISVIVGYPGRQRYLGSGFAVVKLFTEIRPIALSN